MKKVVSIALVIVSVLLVASVALAERTGIPGGPGVLTVSRMPVAE